MPALGSRSMNRRGDNPSSMRGSRKGSGRRVGGPGSSSAQGTAAVDASNHENMILFDDGWKRLESSLIKPLRQAVEASQGDSRAIKRLFSQDKFASLYTHIYTMCTQKAPHNWSGKLYFEYRKGMGAYLKKTSLAAIQRQCDRALSGGMEFDSASPTAAEAVLQEVDQQWQNHRVIDQWGRKFFNYLNRFYVQRLAVDSLDTVALKSFKENVFDVVKEQITAAFCCVVSHERMLSGVGRNDAMLRRIVSMYYKLGRGTSRVYEQELEAALLKSARSDAAESSAAWLESESLSDYLLHAETRLDDESRRTEAYLRPGTHAKIQKVCDDELLGKSKVQTVMLQRADGTSEGNLDWILSQGKRKDLQRLYRLFSRVGSGLENVANAFRDHVNRVGANIVRSTKDARGLSTLVQRLSSLHGQYSELVCECFHDDVLMVEAMRTAFESAANINPPVGKLKMPELVADLFDRTLRRAGKGGHSSRKGRDELSAEASVESASEMFSYLRDKDVFADAYRKQLAKRLLTLRPRDGGALEARAVGLLKERMGAQYTAKLEGMINDIQSTQQIDRDFANYCANPDAMMRASRAGALADEAESVLSPAKVRSARRKEESAALAKSLTFALRVQVLTNGHWPASKPLKFGIPESMSLGKNVFEDFYNLKAANRKLRWAPALGTVVMEARGFPGIQTGRLEIVVSELQCAILLLFNQMEYSTATGIERALGVEGKDLLKHLTPMIRGKYALLTEGGSAFEDGSRISLNMSFTETSGRIKLPVGFGKRGSGGSKKREGHGRGSKESQAQGSESATQKFHGRAVVEECIAAAEDGNSPEVRELRKQLSDAAICKIMKANKRMRLRPLIEAVRKEVSYLWSASSKDLNKRIEDLIERDYIERSEGDQLLLEYVP